MESNEERFVSEQFWMKSSDSKTIHQELISTFGDDAYGVS
jgi:hypothetical protein